jgi:hypothetical protein
MTISRKWVWSLLGALLLASPSLAQQSPPEAAMIRRLDINGDGLLESREIPARARAGIVRLAREADLDLNQPLSIRRIERQLRPQGNGDRGRGGDDRGNNRPRGERWGGGERGGGGEQRNGDWRERFRRGRDEDDNGRRGRGGDRNEREEPGRGSEQVATANPDASRFAFGAEDGSRVRGFGPADVVPPPLEELYDERTLRFVDRMMSRSDRNENGRLESNEWEGIRFGGNPQESDTNGDGVVTREELAARMASRFGQRGSEAPQDPDRRGRFEGRPPFGGGEGPFGWGQGFRNGEGRFPGGPGFPEGGGRFGRGSGFPDGEGRGGRFARPDSNGEQRRRGWGDNGRSEGNDEQSNERIQRFADAMLRRYDRNGNGSLEKDEWSQMRERYAAADANKDSVITSNEMMAHLSNARRDAPSDGQGASPNQRFARGGGRREESDADEKKSYRFLTPAERLEAILSERDRDWFLQRDQDGDGQIAMAEYSDSWTDDKIDEFAALDQNADGVLTPQEYLRSQSD